MIFRKPLPPTPVLETARLILRPYAERDVDAVQRIFPQWEVVRWLHAGVPWPYPDDGAATNMADSLVKRARGERFYWAITLKGDDTLRGRIDLWPFDGETRDMRGFWLDPDLHGQGLMSEAKLVDVERRDYVSGPADGQVWRLDRDAWLANRT